MGLIYVLVSRVAKTCDISVQDEMEYSFIQKTFDL